MRQTFPIGDRLVWGEAAPSEARFLLSVLGYAAWDGLTSKGEIPELVAWRPRKLGESCHPRFHAEAAIRNAIILNSDENSREKREEKRREKNRREEKINKNHRDDRNNVPTLTLIHVGSLYNDGLDMFYTFYIYVICFKYVA